MTDQTTSPAIAITVNGNECSAFDLGGGLYDVRPASGAPFTLQRIETSWWLLRQTPRAQWQIARSVEGL